MPPSLTVDRYASKSHAVRTTLTRLPWQSQTRQKKPQTKTFTPAEKKAAKQVVMVRKEQNNKKVSLALLEVWKLAKGLQHNIGTNTAQHWYGYLLQRAGKQKSSCSPSTWNVFVSLKVKAHNNALPANVPCVKAPAIMADLHSEWNSLLLTEKMDVTQDTVTQLGEVREMRNLATHNVSLTTFHDARATLRTIQTQLKNLHHRTGVKFLLFASRLCPSSYMHPTSWSTGDHINKFFQMTFKKLTGEFAGMLECFLLSGLGGAVQTVHNDLLALKHKVAKLIFDKLTPGSIGSRIEFNTLFHAWETRATHFCRLAPAELDAWQQQQAQAMVALQQQASTSTTPPLPTGLPSAPVTEGTVSPVTPASFAAVPSAGTPPPTTTASPALTMSDATGMFSGGINALVTKKPRKVCSDKGKLCGPSKKKQPLRAAAEADASSGAGLSGSLGAHALT
ncbi:hypothetical protein BC835DRAFT_1423759 [Cytidiella melzeri]|nr:hypothetical protein BC835DRAFT_1423759 [Cytidiella melzeri]